MTDNQDRAAEALAAIIDKATPGFIYDYRYRYALYAALQARAAGWVSPEEVERIKAAARREALLEAAEEFEEDAADAWGGNAPWMTSGVRVANLAAEWLRESAAALAEPERDEESGR